jgi:hypothetical protein
VVEAGVVCALAPSANPPKATARIAIFNVLFMIYYLR